MGKRKDPDHIVHKDKDLRIKDAQPWDVARRLVSGGAPRREATENSEEDESVRHSSI